MSADNNADAYTHAQFIGYAISTEPETIVHDGHPRCNCGAPSPRW